MKDYLGKNIPKLGFGLMRLPMLGDEVDMAQTKKMVDAFMAHGYTYFDTAYGYINGKSEQAAKTAIVDRFPRESFQLATKIPAWAGPQTEAEAKQMFWTSLERTGAGYFDFYLLHNLGNKRSQAFDEFHIWDFVMELKAKGLIRHIGFSMHAKADALDEVLTRHPEMEFVQLQVNYADWEDPSVQSRLCMEVAAKHGKPVIIMEPVKGGNLATPPQPVADLLKAANPGISSAAWALRYAASLPGIITVLSGMSTLAQMEDNLATMDGFQPMSAGEQATIQKARQLLDATPSIPCTDCQYCVKDCPQNINIPQIFKAMNMDLVYGNLKSAKGDYSWATGGGGKASDCVACGQCETACPQQIHIIDELARTAAVLEA